MQTQDDSLSQPSSQKQWTTKGSLKPFKPPRKVRKAISISSSSTEEDMQEDAMDALEESIFREEARDWLSTYGSKLYAVETAKFNAQEARRKNLKSVR